MLLGAYLRATGRSAIYLGASLQLWFGISGGRWLGYSKAKTPILYDLLRGANWTRPLARERPSMYQHFEKGAYW